MTRREQKLKCFVEFALDLGSLSTCKRRHVGCVVADVHLTEAYSIGYNGPPRGIPNDSCDESSTGNCGCVHAEANALVKASSHPSSVLIATCSPCLHCAGLILNTPWIDHVMFVDTYRDPAGVDRLVWGGMRHRYDIDFGDVQAHCLTRCNHEFINGEGR